MYAREKMRHTEKYGTELFVIFFSRIHTKKYQFSFQGVHLKNNGNLKCGQFEF